MKEKTLLDLEHKYKMEEIEAFLLECKVSYYNPTRKDLRERLALEKTRLEKYMSVIPAYSS